MADEEEYEEVIEYYTEETVYEEVPGEVLYKQNWEDTKDKYLLPPDAPELVQAIKNTAMFSKQKYKEDYEKKVKGKWSETPCFEIATARMNADNLSTVSRE
ncbi:Nebulin [Cricetulus griseus]|uniref:Nebulin n=1 Tax=Cricetulus griseus TaxID=10029 RepID=G3IMP8_CRIGR|nr:Nebulin [Cricetulus griseus]